MQTVIEMLEFTAQAKKLLSEQEISDLITMLAEQPISGDIMVGTGGFRKLRLARKGGGKSGGYRVIYFFYNENHPLLLTSVYAKNDKGNLTKDVQNRLAKLARLIKTQWR